MFTLNKTRPFITNAEIVEWDIQSANISLIKRYQLLSEKRIEKIEGLDKQKRVIAVGKISGKDKDFAKKLEASFDEVIRMFILANQLDQEFDILSIKRDAVFVVNKTIQMDFFPPHIKFIPKNNYHAFLWLKPYEFYVQRNGIHVKGIGDDKVDLHVNGILHFLREVVDITEKVPNMKQKKSLHKFLAEFVDAYKKKELPFDYYREFNSGSAYRIDLNGSILYSEHMDEILFQSTDISFNYKTIILPLIQYLV